MCILRTTNISADISVAIVQMLLYLIQHLHIVVVMVCITMCGHDVSKLRGEIIYIVAPILPKPMKLI